MCMIQLFSIYLQAPVAGTSADDGDNQPLRKEHWKRKGNFEGEGDKRTSKRLDILNRKVIDIVGMKFNWGRKGLCCLTEQVLLTQPNQTFGNKDELDVVV